MLWWHRISKEGDSSVKFKNLRDRKRIIIFSKICRWARQWQTTNSEKYRSYHSLKDKFFRVVCKICGFSNPWINSFGIKFNEGVLHYKR